MKITGIIVAPRYRLPYPVSILRYIIKSYKYITAHRACGMNGIQEIPDDEEMIYWVRGVIEEFDRVGVPNDVEWYIW